MMPNDEHEHNDYDVFLSFPFSARGVYFWIFFCFCFSVFHVSDTKIATKCFVQPLSLECPSRPYPVFRPPTVDQTQTGQPGQKGGQEIKSP